MSFGDNRRASSAFAAEPDAARTVKIMPNRRSLDNKFPVLGFTVQTGGLPFFEVLLTTDRALFAPANAGRRNAGNFYASRQDSGLLRSGGPGGMDAIYLAPPAVLRAFAQAEPKPQAIYYTLIAYRSAEGGGPLFAQAPESLPTEAPSVTLAADFTGQTLSTMLGIPVGQLKTIHTLAAQQPVSAQNGWGYASGSSFADAHQSSPAGDRGEGEDGYELAQSAGHADWADWPEHARDYTAQSYAADDYDLVGAQDFFADAYAEPKPKVNGYAGATLTDEGELDYQDGYESAHGPVHNALAGAQESSFPAGATEPAPLSDEEQPYGEDLADDESFYDSYGAAAAAAPSAAGAYGEAAALDDEEEGEPYHNRGAAGETELPPEGEDEYEEYDRHAAAPEDDYYGDEAALSFQALDAPSAPAAGAPLSVEIKKRIIERIAKFESGRERYSAINPDGEYEGRFGTSHPAYQRYHIGLSYGLIQFTQDSGLLGRLLVMMRQRDTQTFAQTFGGDPQTLQQLIDVTTVTGPASRQAPNGRSARVQPVGGADLWREPWLTRFRQAGQHVPFQAAQNQLAAEAFLDPLLRFAAWLGLDTERALALVVDRAIQMGPGGAQRWIISVVGPLQTTALQQQALAALGHGDLRQFQRATPGLSVDGVFGPLTHAALSAALRALGTQSPIPLPTREQMMDAMVRAAAGQRWGRRVSELRQTGDLNDTPLQF